VSLASPRDVLDFWFKEIPSEAWFKSDPAVDSTIRERFEETWHAARAGALADWANSQDGTLAYVILLDQFSRNMFRSSANAYATDGLAREAARHAIARGFDLELPASARHFLYMPLMHSEALGDQEDCVRLMRERMGETHFSYPFAVRHRDAIARFGRFPARNRALGRQSSPEEIEFLHKNPIGF